MSLILRHNPSIIGLKLDVNGWANVDELIAKCAAKGKRFGIEDLKYVVANCEKQRYTFNKDCTKVRANQGHSINVNLELEPQKPPEMLFHGTASRNVDSILKDGIQKRNRQYVHLSIDIETATQVGQRHGKVVLLKIKSDKMDEDGFKFYLSKNNVWLTDYIEPKYIELH